MNCAVVTRMADKLAEGRANGHGYRYVVGDGWELPAERTLFVASGAAVPYQLLEVGFGLLQRWDVACPLWRYEMLAGDVGTAAEQKRTAAIVLDLRVLLYAHELLFVRDSPDGRRFLQTWLAECQGEAEPRLAFLRAMHLVKPLFCALPQSWLGGAAVQAGARVSGTTGRAKVKPAELPTIQAREGGLVGGGNPDELVRVEVGRRRYIQCRRRDVETMRERYRVNNMTREQRRAAGR